MAPTGPMARPRSMDADSAAWVAGLAAADRDATVARLRELLLRVARAETRRRAGTHGLRGPELDDLAEQAASDATMSVLRRLDDFRGDSRFTTWAYKFVVLEVAGKVTRHAWRRAPVLLDAETWERLPGRLGGDPADAATAAELVAAVRTAVESELTSHQRLVFGALVLRGVPLDVLVDELGSNRNAVYQTMFQARRRIRAHLVAAGHLQPERKGER